MGLKETIDKVFSEVEVARTFPFNDDLDSLFIAPMVLNQPDGAIIKLIGDPYFFKGIYFDGKRCVVPKWCHYIFENNNIPLRHFWVINCVYLLPRRLDDKIQRISEVRLLERGNSFFTHFFNYQNETGIKMGSFDFPQWNVFPKFIPKKGETPYNLICNDTKSLLLKQFKEAQKDCYHLPSLYENSRHVDELLKQMGNTL